MRGDQPDDFSLSLGRGLFTPQARGSTQWVCHLQHRKRIYPACAGINLSDCPICGGRIHLPRVCGDQPREGAAFEQVSQFTPHARGSTQPQDQSSQCPAIYPACAGVNPGGSALSFGILNLPRLRGDQPGYVNGANGRLKFSPHARGSTMMLSQLKQRKCQRLHKNSIGDIIPIYAE